MTQSRTISGTRERVGRMLIIDDEPAIGRALERLLADLCEVVIESDANAALARLQAGERFDLVLCDISMPVMDGTEFHRRLRQTNPEEADRVVFISGGSLSARTESFLSSVPNLVLEKPIDLDGLRALVERRTGAGAQQRTAT